MESLWNFECLDQTTPEGHTTFGLFIIKTNKFPWCLGWLDMSSLSLIFKNIIPVKQEFIYLFI